MSDRLEVVKAQFDAMIERMKEECYRRVDLEMEVLLEMWREEKRQKNTRARAVKKMNKDKAGGEDKGGQESEDNEDSVSVKSEIESDECGCDSDGEDNSNFEVKEELPDREDATAPVASTSGGRKRQAMPARNVPAKKRRITLPVDTEHQESASESSICKLKIISVDCTVEACQCTFRCVHKMREHLLAFHQVHPFQCRAQGCGQQFDKKGELSRHCRTHPRATTTWLCPHCPRKTYPSFNIISHHISNFHQTGQFQCTVDQCQFTATTRGKVYFHQKCTHSTVQYTGQLVACSKVFREKQHLTAHQLVQAKQHGHIVTHIRTVHFKLPSTPKEQHHLGIIDHRNPNDFIQVNEEALAND